jgi:hypothetical protein
VQEFPICQPSVKDSLGSGTSANIAHADKKNAVFEVAHFFNWLKLFFKKYNRGCDCQCRLSAFHVPP